jgi:hypothetical protein
LGGSKNDAVLHTLSDRYVDVTKVRLPQVSLQKITG